MNILLIDDEKEFCHQVKEYLEQHQHTVISESDGNRAFSRFLEIKPDLVIIDVDLGLQALDGLAICSQISQSDHYLQGQLGVVMISGHYIAPNDEVIGLQVGADNYLVKPFELPQLHARIDALARRLGNQQSGSTLLHCGELQLNTAARKVFVSGEPLALSRLEFDVLAYLLTHMGVVKTKSELLDDVWKTQHIEEGSITKCMSGLRRKLNPDEPERFIKTVYGVGYRIDREESAV